LICCTLERPTLPKPQISRTTTTPSLTGDLLSAPPAATPPFGPTKRSAANCTSTAAPFLPVRLRRSSLCQTNNRWLLGDQPHELPSFSFGSKGKTKTKTKEKEKSKLGSLFFFILLFIHFKFCYYCLS